MELVRQYCLQSNRGNVCLPKTTYGCFDVRKWPVGHLVLGNNCVCLLGRASTVVILPCEISANLNDYRMVPQYYDPRVDEYV